MGGAHDWYDPEDGAGDDSLCQATHVESIWIPYGE